MAGTSVSTLLADPGPSIFYDPDFRYTLEAHIQYLINDPAATRQIPENDDYIRYNADFYGYLNHIGMPKYMQWITMRMNGMDDPMQFNRSVGQLTIPAQATLATLRTRYTTLQTI